MSDINVNYTQQAKTASTTLGGGTNGVASLTGGLQGGGSFFDMIFARMAEGNGEVSLMQTKTTAATLTDKATAKTDEDGEDVVSNLLALLASTVSLDNAPEVAVDANAGITNPLSTDEALSTVSLDAEGTKKLQETLDTLLQGLPADQRPVTLHVNGTQLKAAMKKLDIDANDIMASSQSLIATGLSPEDLTTLVNLINGDEAAAADAALELTLIGTVKMVPASTEGAPEVAIFLPKTMTLSKADEKTTADGTEEIAAALNALSVGGTPAPTTAPALPELGDTVDADGVKSTKGDRGFDDVLKLLEQIQAKGAEARGGQPAPGLEQATTNNAAKHGPVNSTMGSSFNGTLGTLMNSTALGDFFPDGLDWAQGANGISNTQVTGTAQLTSLVTHARDATQPHAATQFVAATLTKSAQTGESKNMTLRLDPPELGKIEIQMHFTKDKSVKTHMIFEKPETMLMMQRDSHALERAMQQSGLDANGNSLSFELSSGDHSFDDNRGNGGNDYGNKNRADAGQTEIIETTMSWYVDENTGMQHYNILA